MSASASASTFVLSEEEQLVVKIVHDFVEQKVKPVVRDREHANTCPEALLNRVADRTYRPCGPSLGPTARATSGTRR